jgi:hypothetical protein
VVQKGIFPQPQINESNTREIGTRGGQSGIRWGPCVVGALIYAANVLINRPSTAADPDVED